MAEAATERGDETLILKLADLTDDSVQLEFEWPAERVREVAGAQAFESISPCGVTIEAYMAESTLVCRGHVRCAATMACSRCLDPVPVELGGPLDFAMDPASARPRDEEWDDEDVAETGYGYYDGDSVDLEPLVADVVALSVPMQVYCREECKGLCPKCGKNLNEGPCFCPKWQD